MGNSTPGADKTKITHIGKNQEMQFVCMEMRGWRKSMQDSSIYQLQIPTPENKENYKNSLFAVFDGHGTNYISQFLKMHFVPVLVGLEEYQKQHYTEALEKTFMLLDQKMISPDGQKILKKIKQEEDEFCDQGKYHPIGEKIGDLCGSTANVVLVTQKFYFVANCGDSRSILCRNGYCLQLSKDHKPDQQTQISRIRKANGFVNYGRINDILSVSRAFGDFQLKGKSNLRWDEQIVTCKPQIESYAKSSRDEFLLIACDGIWENYDNSKEIMELLVKEKPFRQQHYQQALESLLNKLVAKDENQQLGQDNMTVLFVKFKHRISEKSLSEDQQKK